MAKMKKNKTTKIIYKMLHRKLNNDQHESHYKLGRGGGGGGGTHATNQVISQE